MFPCLRLEKDYEDSNDTGASASSPPRETTGASTSPTQARASKVDVWEQKASNIDHLYKPRGKKVDAKAKLPKRQLEDFIPSEGFYAFGPPENLESIIVTQAVCCQSTSTYPIDIKKKARAERDGSKFKGEKMGDPICDSYAFHLFRNYAIMAIADGCNWGPKPYEASRTSCKAFLEYMADNLKDIHTLQQACAKLLKGFAHAQRMILQVPISRGQEPGNTGTTTLLGGLIAKLQKDDDKEGKDWVFVCMNLGDCKVFRYSINKSVIQEITEYSRPNESDMSDPGGRLGPSNKEAEADLRNLSIFTEDLDEGDILIALSDGVYDNFDPEFLGYTPEDLELGTMSWSALDRQKCHDAKLTFRNKLLMDIVLGDDKRVKNPSIDTFTSKVLDHCQQTTKASRKWVKEHPDSRMPNDRSLFKGKMDHSTCACFVVGAEVEQEGMWSPRGGTIKSKGKKRSVKNTDNEGKSDKKGKSKNESEDTESGGDEKVK